MYIRTPSVTSTYVQKIIQITEVKNFQTEEEWDQNGHALKENHNCIEGGLLNSFKDFNKNIHLGATKRKLFSLWKNKSNKIIINKEISKLEPLHRTNSSVVGRANFNTTKRQRRHRMEFDANRCGTNNATNTLAKCCEVASCRMWKGGSSNDNNNSKYLHWCPTTTWTISRTQGSPCWTGCSWVLPNTMLLLSLL